MTVQFFSLSPALLSRIDRLSACQGQWIVDCREIEGNYSYALRSLSDHWQILIGEDLRYWRSLDGVPNLFKLGSVEDAAQYCAATHWQARLLFSPSLLNADCLWPGCYEASSLHRSNNRVFKENHEEALLLADGDADGLALDVRYITEEMLEDIESLEQYPLLSEDDHSCLEMEDQERAWTDWAERDYQRALEERLLSLSEDDDWEERAEELVESLSSDALRYSFEQLREEANEYWQEESCYGQWINVERIVENADPRSLLSLLSESLSEPLRDALAPLLKEATLSAS